MRSSKLDVAERDFGDHQELNVAAALDRGVDPCARGVHGASRRSEDIDFPGDIDVEIDDCVFQASDAFAGERRDRAETILAGAKTRGATTGLDVGVVTAGGRAPKGACLAHAGHGDTDIMVLGDSALDVRHQGRVLERFPPLDNRGPAR